MRDLFSEFDPIEPSDEEFDLNYQPEPAAVQRRHEPLKGRGTGSNIAGRFAINLIEVDDNDEPMVAPQTQVRHEYAKSIISRNQSPDVPFSMSVNPYRGCEHGCLYCFARPSHAYLDLSPGLDFETKLSAKINAPELLEQELSHPRYQCQPIAIGINTDAYQPIEKELRITRQLLEVALKFKQPVSIITKSSLILRDLDLLTELAEQGLFHAAVSITTLNNDLKRRLEPRTASGATRLQVVQKLTEAGIPTAVLAAPMIPFVNDNELESIIQGAAAAGAHGVNYMMLRLPYELGELFEDWLRTHLPDRADRVLNQIREMRGGELNNAQFGLRMTGQGAYADLMRQRFYLAARKAGLDTLRQVPLNTQLFTLPPKPGDQFSLFD
ncbi:PA0069 family radical SAM protein [Maribrevibacterium harenarium]|uniref:PA0069 family radical SAM protein n=1 Tax=Maribrevibacterium harenarium TaxID=2589817 RepID=A0A501WJ81_9GAMM|nr:PA0069 family radical SAM protein [Maribrevibacterium harenarium]TPE47197.1 PA0069 family radical SAM protein [Maribrevibacterium harenarium]